MSTLRWSSARTAVSALLLLGLAGTIGALATEVVPPGSFTSGPAPGEHATHHHRHHHGEARSHEHAAGAARTGVPGGRRPAAEWGA